MKRRKVIRQLVGVGAGLVLAGTLVAAPAAAEGEFTSELSGVYTPHDSRDWWDAASDSNATTVNFVGICTYLPGFSSADISLWANAGIFPDFHVATKKNYCGLSNFGSGANFSQDWFHWKLEKINNINTGPFWVDEIVTKY